MLALLVISTTSMNYDKKYYDNGILKSEGWIDANQKTKYWFYYHPNGNLKAEGHYIQNKKSKYWYYYDDQGNIKEQGRYFENLKSGWWKEYKPDTLIKVEYEEGVRHGLVIYEIEGTPVKAEYFKNGTKTNEWFNLRDFRKEYPKVND
jgi:antitoxin component YwqK of YwqJK toxin-antitoxin module